MEVEEEVSSFELDSACFFDLYLYTSKEDICIKHISTSFKDTRGNSYCLAKLFVPISFLAKSALDLFIIKQQTNNIHHKQGTHKRYINWFHPFTFINEKVKLAKLFILR